jgi:hypothetical protein
MCNKKSDSIPIESLWNYLIISCSTCCSRNLLAIGGKSFEKLSHDENEFHSSREISIDNIKY